MPKVAEGYRRRVAAGQQAADQFVRPGAAAANATLGAGFRGARDWAAAAGWGVGAGQGSSRQGEETAAAALAPDGRHESAS